MKNTIHQLYIELLRKHGDPVKLWPQWCAKEKDNELREIIAIGAILTQKTSWRNADLALRNLKKEKLLSLEKIAGLGKPDILTGLIRPAGFYQTKPQRVFDFASFIVKECKTIDNLIEKEVGTTREKLLSLKGIGPETADVILLYALDIPSFVIDEYTKRLVAKRNLTETFTYDYLKQLFEDNLPKDVEIYQNYHALIIIEQRGRKTSRMEVI
ncbi:endonuclease [Patescibacteria group bacterium]|nr:endonuclease [Patescibacteria group bacterium]MBU1868280.1 endonuclease [Patescibacteria group bacterium]